MISKFDLPRLKLSCHQIDLALNQPWAHHFKRKLTDPSYFPWQSFIFHYLYFWQKYMKVLATLEERECLLKLNQNILSLKLPKPILQQKIDFAVIKLLRHGLHLRIQIHCLILLQNIIILPAHVHCTLTISPSQYVSVKNSILQPFPSSLELNFPSFLCIVYHFLFKSVGNTKRWMWCVTDDEKRGLTYNLSVPLRSHHTLVIVMRKWNG